MFASSLKPQQVQAALGFAHASVEYTRNLRSRDIARYLENPAANAPKSASVAWGSRPRSRFPQPPGPPL